MPKDRYDVIIVGGGVTGTAVALALARYSNVKRVALIEKYSAVGQVNSNALNNAQTSHDGGTETNYTLSHALEVQRAAIMLRNYIDSKGDPLLSQKRLRMAPGFTAEEVETLKKRFEEFRPYYPDLALHDRKWLLENEPKLVEGRDPDAPICALVSTEGYIVNYARLAQTFLDEAKKLRPDFDICFDTEVRSVREDDDGYAIETNAGTMHAKAVEFAAGAYSLLHAEKLGYGLDYALLSVAGSFYTVSGNILKNKVYPLQIEGMPFARVHGDPDIIDPTITRFGPTTKPLPLMERHRYKTFFDYLKLPLLTMRGIWSLYKILANEQMVTYVVKNVLYDMPIIGPLLFLPEAKAIVPTVRYRDLKLRRGAGGIRPQIVDLRTGKLVMGDVTIVGKRCIFNTTPSPGASVCLANAKRDAGRLIEFLGGGYHFDRAKFEKELEAPRF